MSGHVFITGALGFIGRALGERFRADGFTVSGVDARADSERDVVAADISSAGDWQTQMEGAELVIHTAAVVSNAVSLERCWQVNVMGTRHVVDGAARAGARRLVHFSSIRAFSDRHFPDGVTERHPVRTDGNAYVDTKIASEHVVLQAQAAGEVHATIIRPGDVYGPGSRPWVLLPLEAIRAGTFALPARGRGVFSPVYVDNLVDGVVLAAGSDHAAGQIFTLSDGIAVTTAEYFGYLYRMLGRAQPRSVPTAVGLVGAAVISSVARLRGAETEINPQSVRYLARTGGYSIVKAQEVLGYEPQVHLPEGMRRTEAWLRAECLI